MNLLHMKYAVEIAETKSINKAAEKLFVGQSALSRAIKDLEASLGVTLFERSAKGMFPTPDGEVFVRYAKTVLKQVDAIENMFSGDHAAKTQFSISVPRASYIADAFAKFSKLIEKGTDAELFYKETNALRAIKNLLNDEFKLGIVRYAESFDKYYKNMMDEKGLEYELIAEFRYKLLFHKDSPLAQRDELTYDAWRDLCRRSRFRRSKKRNFPIIPTERFLFLSVQVNLNCWPRTMRPLCGHRRFPVRCLNDTASLKGIAGIIKEFTRMFLFIAKITRCPRLTICLLRSL